MKKIWIKNKKIWMKNTNLWKNCALMQLKLKRLIHHVSILIFK